MVGVEVQIEELMLCINGPLKVAAAVRVVLPVILLKYVESELAVSMLPVVAVQLEKE